MRALVALFGVAAWLAALVLIARFRQTTAPTAAVFGPDATFRERLGILLGRGAGALAGCIAAGILVIGVGGRLMMRVLAATSSDGVQGAITDMDAVIGEVTVGGTLGFIAFVGTGAGVIGWMLRLAFRRWLPRRSMSAGIFGAALGAGLLARGSSLLEPSSDDFDLLSPDWLSVGLILGLILTFGLLLSVLADRLTDAWPIPKAGAEWLWVAPLGALIVVPPMAVALGLATLGRARLGDVDARLGRIDPTARVVVRSGAVVGGAWTLAAAFEILFAA